MRKREGRVIISLTEILLSLFLLSLILLGLDAIQFISLRETNGAYYFRAAMEEVEGMNQRLKYISEEDMESEIVSWNQEIRVMLPQGKGFIEKGRREIKIIWGGMSAEECRENKMGSSGCLLLG